MMTTYLHSLTPLTALYCCVPAAPVTPPRTAQPSKPQWMPGGGQQKFLKARSVWSPTYLPEHQEQQQRQLCHMLAKSKAEHGAS